MNHVTLVMGGQFGSEGKGNVVSWLSRERKFDLVIRTGSPNSGHTFIDKNNKPCVMRQLPCSWAFQDSPLYVPASAIVDTSVLKSEIELVRDNGYKGKIMVSPNVGIVELEDIKAETNILSGTTGTGSGSARSRKCMRQVRLAKDISSLRKYLATPDFNNYSEVLIESSQGFGLSLDSSYYPYVTSTNLTPYRILDDAEIPFNKFNISVWLLLRTFPIRIAGLSGPLPMETSWGFLRMLYGSHIPNEYTSVTRKQRRVGFFDVKQARDAIQRCNPNVIVLTFFDYLFPLNKYGKLPVTRDMIGWLSVLEDSIERHITYLGISCKDLIGNTISDPCMMKRYKSESLI